MAENPVIEEKKHAACDECRTRKLKCAGGNPNCQRCQVEGLHCIYSPRKRMGRPRKRRREDEVLNDFDFDNLTPDLGLDSVKSNYFGVPGLGIPRTDFEPSLMDALEFGNMDPALTGITSTPGNLEGNNGNIDPFSGNEMTFSGLQDLSLSTGPGETVQDLANPPGDASTTFGLELQQPGDGTCLCLSSMYLTVSNLSTVKEFQFPWHVSLLKVAMNTSSTVLDCRVCPKQSGSAMQNIMMLTTLLTTLIECYRKVLINISKEEARAAEAGETMHYRMGDSSPERMHMHTGTLDCPMGFNLDLEPAEWKALATKVVKADINGTSSGGTSILGLVKQLEERQHKWHAGEASSELRDHFSQQGRSCNPQEGDFTCMKLVGMIRNHVELLKL